MADSDTDYKEAPFAEDGGAKDIPVKVHIIAPSTLPEGYVFEAEVGEPRVNIPTGQWKDEWYDMIKAGPCHPSLWCALCFTQGEFVLSVDCWRRMLHVS